MASRQIQQEQQPWLLENGHPKVLTKESRHGHGRSRTAHNMSSSSLRKKSDRTLVSKIRCASVRNVVANLQEVILGTKLSILFPAIPAAIVAHYLGLGRVSSFLLNLILQLQIKLQIAIYYYNYTFNIILEFDNYNVLEDKEFESLVKN